MTSMPAAPPYIELSLRSDLAAAISRQLTAQSLSVHQLAAAAGIDQRRLEQKLHGIGTLTVPEFVKIASQLDCKPSDLIQD